MRKASVLLGSLLLMFAFASVAFAHAEMKNCTPEINGTIETAPAQVVCKATESLDPKGSSLAVYDEMGMQVDKGDSTVDLNDPDRVTISVSLDTAMMEHGVYTVKWTTLSTVDDDKANGEFKFTIGHGMHMEATPAPDATDTTMHPNGDQSIGVATVNGKDITLKILSPKEGAEVPAGMIKVETALEGATLGAKDSHVHFYVDDNLALMGKGAENSAEIEIKEPGEHVIKASFSDQEHDDLIQVNVRVMVKAADAVAQAAATMPPMQAVEPTKAAMPTHAMPAAAPTAIPTPMPARLDTENVPFLLFTFVIGILAMAGGIFFAARKNK